MDGHFGEKGQGREPVVSQQKMRGKGPCQNCKENEVRRFLEEMQNRLSSRRKKEDNDAKNTCTAEDLGRGAGREFAQEYHGKPLARKKAPRTREREWDEVCSGREKRRMSSKKKHPSLRFEKTGGERSSIARGKRRVNKNRVSQEVAEPGGRSGGERGKDVFPRQTEFESLSRGREGVVDKKRKSCFLGIGDAF